MNRIENSIRLRLPGGVLWNRLNIARARRNSFDCELMQEYFRYCKFTFIHGERAISEKLESYFSERSFLSIEDIKIPSMKGHEINTFWYEFPDLVLPYVLEKRGKKYDYEELNKLFIEGPYELNENISVGLGDIVIDCGANLGLFSAIAGEKAERVYAFEPDPNVVGRLQKTVSLNKSNIQVLPKALGDRVGSCMFAYDKVNLGGGRVIKQNLNKNMENTMTVESTTLDQFVVDFGIKRIDFIKADIEGAERNMLWGAKTILREMGPKLSICTYHLPDDKDVLEKIVLDANPNYRVEHYYQKMYAYIPQ